MQEELKQLLLEAGLSIPEITIYLELLAKPAHNKWELVVRTKLDKNKVYRAFEKLEELKMIIQKEDSIETLSLSHLISKLETEKTKYQNLTNRIKEFSPFLKIPVESMNDFQVMNKKEDILDKYLQMSEMEYDTCLDFGDLEAFVNVLGGLDPVFKFRKNRFSNNAKNIAICTSTGPNTSCMMRKQDMDAFKSNIDLLRIKFKGKWIIFSDSNDYVMFNNFADEGNLTSVLVKSKTIADTQRLQFDQFSAMREA